MKFGDLSNSSNLCKWNRQFKRAPAIATLLVLSGGPCLTVQASPNGDFRYRFECAKKALSVRKKHCSVCSSTILRLYSKLYLTVKSSMGAACNISV